MHVKRSVKGSVSETPVVKTFKPPVVRKGKLVVVDLAGSERIDKSGTYVFIAVMFREYHYLYFFRYPDLNTERGEVFT